MATLAPSRSSAAAMARPMPRDPPVTIATLPWTDDAIRKSSHISPIPLIWQQGVPHLHPSDDQEHVCAQPLSRSPSRLSRQPQSDCLPFTKILQPAPHRT